MPAIVTVTANTGIDEVIDVDRLIVGGVSRARRSVRFPSGKGINATRTMSTLGRRVTALGLVGRDDAAFFASMASPHCRIALTPVSGRTRTNVSFRDRWSGTTTHVTGCGFDFSGADAARFLAGVREVVGPGDLVVVSGSLPTGLTDDTYKHIVMLAHDRGACVILDACGEPLRLALPENPDLIKPNLQEIAQLVESPSLATDLDVARAARRASRMGARVVVVSRGAAGAIVWSHESRAAWKAWLNVDPAPAIIDPIGCGDAMVAGIAAAWIDGKPLLEQLRMGIACAVANLLSVGPGVCDAADIARLAPAVRIEPLDLPVESHEGGR